MKKTKSSNTNNLSLKAALLCAVVFSAFSCQVYDDPLDKTQSYDVFKDSTRVDNYILGLYTYLPVGFNRFSNQTMLSSAGDESTQCKTTHGLTPFVNGSWGPSSNPDAAWTSNYEAIMMVNTFFENIGMLYPQTSGTFKQSVTAEAHFLRAYFYFELVKRYAGVPLLTRTMTGNDSPDIPRASYQECVDFIVAECDSAIKYLPVQETNARWGRASKVGALALKARMLLYAASPLFNGPDVTGANNPVAGYGVYSGERWEKAADAAHDLLQYYPNVIDLYKTGTNYPLRYRNVFTVVMQDNNKEWLFVRTRPADNNLEKDNAPIGFINARGGVCPSQNLVDAYEMANGKPITDPTSGYNPNDPYAKRDPRFEGTIQYNGASWWGRAIKTSLGGIDAGDVNVDGTKTGYYLRKFSNVDATIIAAQVNKPHFFPLFRFAEVLLNYAEAMNEAYGPNNAGPYEAAYTARWAVDLVRQRVNMPKLPANITYGEMKERIMHERRIELAFEEHRHWDVRRWKTAEATFSAPIKGVRINESVTPATYEYYDVESRAFTPKMYLYPIPYADQFRDKALVQNPLWNE